MKKTILICAVLVLTSALFAVEHPIQPQKNSELPGSFYIAGAAKNGISCIKNESGKYIFRIDAKDSVKKLISGTRIQLGQGDSITLKLKLNVRGKGMLGTGFYIYDGKVKFLTALYTHAMELVPGKTDYSFTGIVKKNPKEKSAFDRPTIGIIFFDAKKGTDFDIEKIDYEVKKAPEAKVVIPEI